MDVVKTRLAHLHAALAALDEALELSDPSPLERDGAIQRFEFTFEAFWKAAKSWLERHEGLPCASPRACIRALGQAGIFDPAETTAALVMADDRSLTVHTYNQETAQAIFQRLPAHATLIHNALERIQRSMTT